MFSFFKNRASLRRAADAQYKALLDQARHEALYTDYAVSDDVTGRFEMIALHTSLFMVAVSEKTDCDEKWIRKLPQKIFDVVFKDLDRALRELGIGDLSVPKKMKKFMQSFNGRITTYGDIVKRGDEDAMKQAVFRNIYAESDAVSDEVVAKMARYIIRLYTAHEALSCTEVAAGKVGAVKP